MGCSGQQRCLSGWQVGILKEKIGQIKYIYLYLKLYLDRYRFTYQCPSAGQWELCFVTMSRRTGLQIVVGNCHQPMVWGEMRTDPSCAEGNVLLAGKNCIWDNQNHCAPQIQRCYPVFVFDQYYWAVCSSPWCLFASAFPPSINSLGTFSSTWLFCSARKLAERVLVVWISGVELCKAAVSKQVSKELKTTRTALSDDLQAGLRLVLTWKGLCGNQSLQ